MRSFFRRSAAILLPLVAVVGGCADREDVIGVPQVPGALPSGEPPHEFQFDFGR